MVRQVRFQEVVLQGLGRALGEHADEAVAVAVPQGRVVGATAVRGAAAAAGGLRERGTLVGACAQPLAAVVAGVPRRHTRPEGVLVVVLASPEVLLLLASSAGFVVCRNGMSDRRNLDMYTC